MAFTIVASRVLVLLLYPRRCLALALLVSKVVANDHDSAVTTYDFALVANLLDARLYLHDQSLLTCTDK